MEGFGHDLLGQGERKKRRKIVSIGFTSFVPDIAANCEFCDAVQVFGLKRESS